MGVDRETVRQGYLVVAENYHHGRLAKEQVNIEWIDGLRSHLPDSGRVVDLGCGSGVPITRYFATRGYEVTGYDISDAMLGIARREVPQAQFFQAAVEELDLDPSSIDLVLSFFAIIHIDRKLHEGLFSRLFDWLKPGGAAFLSLGADDNPFQKSEDWHGAPMVWSHFGAEENLALLGRAGFQIAWHEVEELGNERHLFVIASKDPT